MVEKKWNFSESLRIDEQCDKAILLCRSAYDETVTGNDTILAIGESLALIRVANEARDKSRTLPAVKCEIPLVLHDLCEPMTRSLLEIGFDLALAAVGPQLKTVEFLNPADKTGMISWNPPENPFRRASTTITEDKDCGLGGCPKHARRENAPCIEEPIERWQTTQTYRDQQADKIVSNIEKQVDPVRAAVVADFERAQQAKQPKEPVCASTRGFECDCAGTICKAGSR